MLLSDPHYYEPLRLPAKPTGISGVPYIQRLSVLSRSPDGASRAPPPHCLHVSPLLPRKVHPSTSATLWVTAAFPI